MKKFTLSIVLFILLLAGCFHNVEKFTLKTALGEVQIKAEVADSLEERQRGLMGRKKLGADRGMWFSFEDEEPRIFWMKNTPIPLDIIFFNKEKKVVKAVEGMQPCALADLQCPRYSSELPAMYALEVNAGFVREKGMKVGDVMQ